MQTWPVASPPASKPLVLYDGDCGFCRRWIGRWRRLTGDRVDYAEARGAAGRFPEIPAAAWQASVVLVEPGGLAVAGAAAVVRSVRGVPWLCWLDWAYRRAPGFAPAAEWMYRRVARHRHECPL